MLDRRFTEVDLRRMLEHEGGCRADIVDGRWVVETRRNRKDGEVIAEPDNDQNVLVVVTAYPLEEVE